MLPHHGPHPSKDRSQSERKCRYMTKGSIRRNTMFSHDCLLKGPVGKRCSEGFFKQLFYQLQVEIYDAGDCIVSPGENGHRIFFLHRGEIEALVTPGATRVAKFVSGNVFKEGALFATYKQAVYARALEFSDCRVISSHAFNQIVHQFPRERAFFEHLFRQQVERLEAIKKELDETRAQPALGGSMPMTEVPAEHVFGTMPCQRRLSDRVRRTSVMAMRAETPRSSSRRRQSAAAAEEAAAAGGEPLEREPHSPTDASSDGTWDPPHGAQETPCATTAEAAEGAPGDGRPRLPFPSRHERLPPLAWDGGAESPDSGGSSRRHSCPSSLSRSTTVPQPPLPCPIARLDDVHQDTSDELTISSPSASPTLSCQTRARSSVPRRQSTIPSTGARRPSLFTGVWGKLLSQDEQAKYVLVDSWMPGTARRTPPVVSAAD